MSIDEYPSNKRVILEDPADSTRTGVFDSAFKVLVFTDIQHSETHAGNHYYVKGFQDGSLNFLWVVPNTTKWPHAQWEFDAEGEFEMKLYEDVTTSADGASVTIFNNDRNSSNTAGVAGYTGPTLNSGSLGDGGDGGTLIWSSKIGSNKKASVGRVIEGEIIAKQNVKYWFSVAQIGAGTLWVDWNINWYEHTSA